MQAIRSAVFFCVAVIAASGSAGAKDAAEPFHLSVSWRTEIDAEGRVAQLTALPNARVEKIPGIRAQLEAAVRTWRFVPATLNGHPAPTETTLAVRFTFEQDGASYRVVVDDAHTGGRIGKGVPPHYPRSAVMANKTGLVLLRVDYDADGKVVSSKLDADSPKVDDRLVAAALENMGRWTFEPERVDGHGVPGTQIIPVCFRLSPLGGAPPPDCEWTPPGSRLAIGEGDSLAVNPVAHLATDAAAHAL